MHNDNNVLDKPPSDEPKTNYKRWSFRFLIYLIILTLFIAFDVSNSKSVSWRMTLLSVLTGLFWIVGIVFTIMSHRNRELRDYQYHVSVWGFGIFTVLTIFALLI